MEFECTTTEFHSDALNNSAKPWDQPSTQSKANFVQLLQFHLYSLLRFHVGYCLRQLPSLFSLKFYAGNYMSITKWTDTYGMHYWSVLRITYRKLVWVGFEPMATEFLTDNYNRLRYQAMRSTCIQHQLCTPTAISSLFIVQFSFWLFPLSVATFFLSTVLYR